MSLSIGASLAALTAGGSVGDEVQVAFEHGQLQHPFVAGSLWSGTSAPPTHNTEGTREHPDLHTRWPSHQRMHPAAAASKSDSLPQELLEVIGGTAASAAFVVGACTLGPTTTALLTAFFAGLGPRD